MSQYLKITWWNNTDLGDVLYQDGYKNIINLNIDLEKPEYNTTIETEMNGDNREMTKFRKWEKVYKFEAWLTEDLVDAFTFMAIHDNIEVTMRTGEVLTVMSHTMRVEPEWEEIGCLAKTVVSFAVDYVTAGSCNENMSAECLCETITGTFESIDLISHLPVADPNKLQLIYTVEDIADKRYTASLYQFNSTLNAWVQLPQPDQYSCYTNEDDSTTWICDGQFWQLFPGYIITLTQPAPPDNTIEVRGWIVPGAFCTVWYFDAGLGWVNVGDYSADDLDEGITFKPPQNGPCDVKIEVWNHSCDYDFTETETIIII